MLTIEVEFLMGRATISQWNDRAQPEWPPHPQRLFSALVAAHSELDGDSSPEKALRWLEALPPPEIKADLYPSTRTASSYFVPVNDEVAKAGSRCDFRHLLERRNRQQRFFPTVVPDDPVVAYQWRETPGVDEHRAALKVLVENLTYLGHSSSPVRACLRECPVSPTLFPSSDGDTSLRVPGPGRLDRLRSVHALRLEDESVQPPLGRTYFYEQPNTVTSSLFDRNAIVLRFFAGPRIGLDSTLPLMRHLRNALLSRLGQSAEVISGHDENGSASKKLHMSIVPLGFVGSEYADGSIKGVALVLPSAVDSNVKQKLRIALSEPWSLHLGPLGSIDVAYLEPSARNHLKSLDFRIYTGTSRTWASVTPVVLDRHPKKKGPTITEIISEACARVGLPAPTEVNTGTVSAVRGAPRADEFHGQSKQVENRLKQHTVIRFDRPVRGPVILGAGRFIGLGLCMPFRMPQS